MSILQHINYAYVLSGFAVGFLVGMTGVGGGSLMTPLLILLFGIAPEKAVATDLIYASITKTGGSSFTRSTRRSTGASSRGWPVAACRHPSPRSWSSTSWASTTPQSAP